MASSSVQRGAAWAPLPPNQLASFCKLVDKIVIAGMLQRSARDAELSAQAAVQAEALFGYDSLVVAHLRVRESEALAGLCLAASGAECEVLLRRCWAVLLSLIPLLLRRLEADTLLLGTIPEEDLDYEAHGQATLKNARSMPVPSPAQLQTLASAMGYTTLMLAMYRSLDLLVHPLWPAAQKRTVESFILQGLDVIPRTAGVPAGMAGGEDRVVSIIEQLMSTRTFDATFCAAVLRKWRSDAVSGVLQARGVLLTGVADVQRNRAEFYARQRADVAKHGLRSCALPSCDKTEKTVKEFAGCSGCRSVVHCCLEHQALDWRAHKKACKEKEAARRAEAEAEEGAGGGAAAG